MADNYFSNRISIDERKLDVNEDSSNFDITSSNYSTFIGDVGIQRLKGLAVTRIDVNTLPTNGDDTFPTNKGTFAVLESGTNNYTGQVRILDGGVTRTGKPVPHVGTLGYFAYNGIPDGWVECNGSFLLYAKNAGQGTFKDTEFTELYNVLNSWTNANSDTAVITQTIADGNAFKLPDFRGYFTRCSTTGQIPQTKYNTSNYKNHSHNGSSLYSGDSSGSPELGQYGWVRFVFPRDDSGGTNYNYNGYYSMDSYNGNQGIGSSGYGFYELHTETGAYSGNYNNKYYSFYYGRWEDHYSPVSNGQSTVYRFSYGAAFNSSVPGNGGGDWNGDAERIYSWNQHFHPKLMTRFRGQDGYSGYFVLYQSSGPYYYNNTGGYWGTYSYWPGHIALSPAGTQSGSELLNTGNNGDRTLSAGDHNHYINTGPTARGGWETRPTNIALKLCIKY